MEHKDEAIELDLKKLKDRIQKENGHGKALSELQYADFFRTFKKYATKETEDIKEIVCDYLCKDAAVLDIGSGLGDIVNTEDSISSYVAYEPNPFLATITNKNMSPLSWRCEIRNEAFTESTGLADRKLDLVIISHSIYYVKNKIGLLTHVMKKLVPTGKILIFLRASSSETILRELKQSNMCFTASTLENNIPLPPWEDFGQFISLLLGMDLTVFPDYLHKLYSQMKEQGKFISLPTSCVVVHHSSFKLLAEITPRLLLPGNADYLSFIRSVKNKDAQQHRPIGIARPTTIKEIQEIVKWVYANNVSLSVIGGGHSGHCLNSSALLISMIHFNSINVDPFAKAVTFGTGVTSGMITTAAWKYGFTVPLGARPSVGCGMILQGGIGHFSRLFGLSTHNIIAASIVMINKEGSLLEVDNLSKEKIEQEAFWMVRGAGSNAGIVVNITMKAYPIEYISLTSINMKKLDATEDKLQRYSDYAVKLPDHQSLDLFLYNRDGTIQLSFDGYATMQDSDTSRSLFANLKSLSNLEDMEIRIDHNLSPYEIFDKETYMTFPKGSSFKRCVFVSKPSFDAIRPLLIDCLKSSPSPLSYFHVVHCGGKASRLHNSSFGVQDWEFAIVITGLWNGELRERVTVWVYDVVELIKPHCQGVYSVDLGVNDYRDVIMAQTAFGDNVPKIVSIKQKLDPKSLLCCGCPIMDAYRLSLEEKTKFRPAYPMPDRPKWLVVVSGKRFSGKDYFAVVLKEFLQSKSCKAVVASISEQTKQMYADDTGANFDRLCHDREYKEEHRLSLIDHYKKSVEADPQFNFKQLMQVIAKYASIEVLIITGMREAEVLGYLQMTLCASLSVYVLCSNERKEQRGWRQTESDNDSTETTIDCKMEWDYKFENEKDGDELALGVAESIYLEISKPIEYTNEIERIKSQIVSTNNFPSKGIIFRELLSTSLGNPIVLDSIINLMNDKLKDANISCIVAIESAGFIYATRLSSKMNLPVALIRKSGKLAPLYHSSAYKGSHVAVKSSQRQHEKHHLCLSAGSLLPGQRVVIVDDVLATGDTILACVELIHKAKANLVKVICATEFTSHFGQLRLAKYGVKVESILSFWGK